eukprot:5237836-Amphidinium_carterae.1
MALHHRVVQLKQPPYVDFGIFGPFARKSLRAQRFRAYIPLPDGEFQVREMPGPANFSQWVAAWRVFAAACICLNI